MERVSAPAPIAAGLESVRVVVFGSDDPLDIEEALIESNRQRQKTNEQIGNEYTELTRIIAARESRQGARTDLTSGNQLPEVQKPSKKAAKRLGVSRQTAAKASAVAKRIKQADAAGDKAKATSLRKKLEASVKSAYSEVKAEEKQAASTAAPALPIAIPLPSSVTIHNVNACDMLTLDIAPVHLVITSPPYNVGIDYATLSSLRTARSIARQATKTPQIGAIRANMKDDRPETILGA